MPRARCVVVDPSPAYRSGLVAALHAADLSIWEDEDQANSPPSVAGCGPTVAVMTMADPASRPPDFAGGYAATVALLSRDEAAEYAAALRAGWTGAVFRDAPLVDIVDAVLESLEQRVVLPLIVAAELASGLQTVELNGLTDEQVDWLRFLADGGTVIELAARYAYSEREMYRRLKRCYARLDTTTKT
ncbi:MAG TPA: hypothetical protein VNA14_05740, partial [Mycobacteriales bacterium]|nr:hypothetical protein [Mycobacteriales bacterium]